MRLRRLFDWRNVATVAGTIIIAGLLAYIIGSAVDQRAARKGAERTAANVTNAAAGQVAELLRIQGQKDDRIAMLERTVGEQAQTIGVLAEQLRRADQQPLIVEPSGVRATAKPQPRPSGPAPKPQPTRQPDPKPSPEPSPPPPSPEPCPVPRLPVIGCPIP